jgi:adenylylsulfate kinase
MRYGHKGMVVWLTGLSGSGKSTISHAVESDLHRRRFNVVVLDGDNLRKHLNSDLGFSIEDRNENIRRIGEVAKLFLGHGAVVLVAAISPIRSAREQIRQQFAEEEFLEVYCNCPVETCHERDPKGLYTKASKGEIREFTGITSPYEAPLHPELILETGRESIADTAGRLTEAILERVLVEDEIRSKILLDVSRP